MKQRSYLRNLSLAAIAFIGLVGFSATANAQYGYGQYNNRNPYNNQQYNSGYNSIQQYAITNGYQLGYGSGSNDRNYRANFDLRRSKAYRDADSGYRGDFGNKDAYKQFFRQGFELGYRDGYSGYQRRTFQGYNDYNYSNQQQPYNNYPRHRNNGRNRRSNNRVYVIPY
jgi:hypothetical protein